jgi:hypothetical protein
MSLISAWNKVMGKKKLPAPKDNRAQECAKIALDMAKLLRIDPQKVVDAMQHEIKQKVVTSTIDSDIAAVAAAHEKRIFHVI